MEVAFITLGDVAERLSVPAPTLRNWTDQLEEMDVHYVKRNNRNERVYEDRDLEIFYYVRDVKQEFGRKTTMRDIANLLKSKEKGFHLRTSEDAPSPVIEASNKTGDILSPDDVERLMGNSRVRALVGYAIAQVESEMLQKNELFYNQITEKLESERKEMKLELIKEIKEEMQEGQSEIKEYLLTYEENSKEQLEEKLNAIEENTKHQLEISATKIEESNKNQLSESVTKIEETQKKMHEEQLAIIEQRGAESVQLLRALMEQRQEEAKTKKKFFGLF